MVLGLAFTVVPPLFGEPCQKEPVFGLQSRQRPWAGAQARQGSQLTSGETNMIEYRTTDTNVLSPYPNMTQEDLDDFEAWAKGIDNEYKDSLWIALAVVIFVVFLFWQGSQLMT